MRERHVRGARTVAAAILAIAVAVPAVRMTLPAAAAPRAEATVAPPVPKAVRASAVSAPMVEPTAAPAKPLAAAAEPLVIRRVLDTHGPIRYGSWFWTDGAEPAGALTITIDLKASVLSVFRGGDEIGTTAIIYGEDGRDTPLGTFPILQKDRHHISNLYHAPMPYMLRLTNDGISIHASEIAADYATHGCIGVPAAFAAKLFAIAKLGDRVIVTNKGLRQS